MSSQIDHINLVSYLAYLLCLFSYLPTYVLRMACTYLASTYLPTYYLPITYLPIYLPIYLYIPTYLPTYLLTYLPIFYIIKDVHFKNINQ
jgi:hypothetical protein